MAIRVQEGIRGRANWAILIVLVVVLVGLIIAEGVRRAGYIYGWQIEEVE